MNSKNEPLTPSPWVIFLMICLIVAGCGRESKPALNTGEASASYEDKTAVSSAEDKETLPSVSTDSTVISSTGTEEPDNRQEEQNENKGETEEENMAATLLYQGHGSVRIVTGEGKVIFIDPFMGDGYDLPADLILMTHGHYDHTQEQLIASRNEGCTVIKWSDALKDGKYQNYDLGFVEVETVEAGYNKNHNASECVGFILTFSNGVSVYLSGDTSTTPSMEGFAERKLDYAFLCCDGVYNMDVTEASACAKLIGAKHTIPYHMEPVKDKSGFDMSVAEAFDAPGKLILKPGEELVLE